MSWRNRIPRWKPNWRGGMEYLILLLVILLILVIIGVIHVN